jgi:ATPase family associated with various cellular activities (AAA)
VSIRRQNNRIGWTPPEFYLQGELAGLSKTDFVWFRTQLFELLGVLVRDHNLGPFSISTGYPSYESDQLARGNPREEQECPEHQPMEQLDAIDPVYKFDQLVLPPQTMEQILNYIALVEVASLVFDSWNLRSIEPNPSMAVNFRGPPGTGKTLAAHAIADRLGRKILTSRLSDLESKYHGDGPKNLVQLFSAASAARAVLFIDEAESLLSRRFAQPEQAAESAINSMRTELLMALDSYDGLVIFASNLPHSYDQAIESRLLSIDFEKPDHMTRLEIWRRHLPSALPLSADVSLDTLAAIEGLTGRDIKMSVITAAVATARRGEKAITQEHLVRAARLQSQPRVPGTSHEQLSEEAAESLASVLSERMPSASV